MALSALPAGFDGDVMIVSGDVPLLDAATLTGLLESHRAGRTAGTLLSAVFEDATGYGRIIRSMKDTSVERIVEQTDATPVELEIHEVNAGSYVFKLEPLRRMLAMLNTRNSLGEKYITDVIGLLSEGRVRRQRRQGQPELDRRRHQRPCAARGDGSAPQRYHREAAGRSPA